MLIEKLERVVAALSCLGCGMVECPVAMENGCGMVECPVAMENLRFFLKGSF